MKMVLVFGKTKNKKTTNCFVYSDGFKRYLGANKLRES